MKYSLMAGTALLALSMPFFAGSARAGVFSADGTTIQTFDVTQTGIYDIVVDGAQGGGSPGTLGGLGAQVSGLFSLTAGETLLIAVGIQGGPGGNGGIGINLAAGGGGGGSFVISLGATPLAIAGGGGGGSGRVDATNGGGSVASAGVRPAPTALPAAAKAAAAAASAAVAVAVAASAATAATATAAAGSLTRQVRQHPLPAASAATPPPASAATAALAGAGAEAQAAGVAEVAATAAGAPVGAAGWGRVLPGSIRAGPVPCRRHQLRRRPRDDHQAIGGRAGASLAAAAERRPRRHRGRPGGAGRADRFRTKVLSGARAKDAGMSNSVDTFEPGAVRIWRAERDARRDV